MTSSDASGSPIELVAQLAAWRAAIDEFNAANPPEAWAHARLIDGRWEFIEKGITPPGFRELSMEHPLFSVSFHEPWLDGDRIVLGEDIHVFNDGEFTRLAEPTPTQGATT